MVFAMLNSYVDLKLQCPHRTGTVDSTTLISELFTHKQCYLFNSHMPLSSGQIPVYPIGPSLELNFMNAPVF